MLKHAAAIGLICALGAGPALAQSESDPLIRQYEEGMPWLSNPQFGRDVPMLSGPTIGLDEPLLNFQDRDAYNLKNQARGSFQSIRPGLGGSNLMRDNNGRIIGYIQPGVGDVLIVKDRTGRFMGRIVRGANGQLQMRDRNGRITGRLR